jgi:hypothetical protein
MWPVMLCSLNEDDADVGLSDEGEGEGEGEGEDEDEDEGFGGLIIVGYYEYSRGFKVGRFRFTVWGAKARSGGDLCGL